jgi:hypothetical protein
MELQPTSINILTTLSEGFSSAIQKKIAIQFSFFQIMKRDKIYEIYFYIWPIIIIDATKIPSRIFSVEMLSP